MNETPVPEAPKKWCPRCKSKQEIVLRKHKNPTGGESGFCKSCNLMLTNGGTRSGPVSGRVDF